MIIQEANYIRHNGILGMHWGKGKNKSNTKPRHLEPNTIIKGHKYSKDVLTNIGAVPIKSLKKSFSTSKGESSVSSYLVSFGRLYALNSLL